MKGTIQPGMLTKVERMRLLDIQPVQDKEILVTWEDGHRSLYAYDSLRFHCPCAECVDEWTGKRMLKMENIAKGIRLLRTDAVGLYALRFHWSDGHATGLYSFEFLRSLCACASCQEIKNRKITS